MPRPSAISTVNAFHCTALIRYPYWYILVADLCKVLNLNKFDLEWSKRLKCQTRIFHWQQCPAQMFFYCCCNIYYRHSWGLCATLPINCVMSFHQVLQRKISFDSYYCVHKVRQKLENNAIMASRCQQSRQPATSSLPATSSPGFSLGFHNGGKETIDAINTNL